MTDFDLQIAELARELMMLTLVIAAPILIAGLIVGLGVSLFQALTSVQEQTLSLIPKMFAVMLVTLVILSPTMQLLRDYAERVFERITMFGLS